MSNTYKHKTIAKARKGLVPWSEVKGRRSCRCDRCACGRQYNDRKRRSMADAQMTEYA